MRYIMGDRSEKTDNCQIITWFAVGFRLYTRYRVVREPGWDDYLIIPAALFNLLALIAFYLCTHHVVITFPTLF